MAILAAESLRGANHLRSFASMHSCATHLFANPPTGEDEVYVDFSPRGGPKRRSGLWADKAISHAAGLSMKAESRT